MVIQLILMMNKFVGKLKGVIDCNIEDLLMSVLCVYPKLCKFQVKVH